MQCKVPWSLVFDPGDQAATCGGTNDSEFEAKAPNLEEFQFELNG